jgi:predicted HTH transcriptional regulator
MSFIESFLGSPLEHVTFADLDQLVQGRATEDTELDFKRELYKEGTDFATDVAAMANSAGGALVIGVEEKDGLLQQ